jgi:hypothetical protein
MGLNRLVSTDPATDVPKIPTPPVAEAIELIVLNAAPTGMKCGGRPWKEESIRIGWELAVVAWVLEARLLVLVASTQEQVP